MLSPINQPGKTPLWSSLIILSRTCLRRSAIDADAIVYATFKSEIGLQLKEFGSCLLWGYM